jgi:hypothetical protein
MLRQIREQHPSVRLMITYNANSNGPMLTINSSLGFAVHKQVGACQITRDAIGTYLESRMPAA